MQFVILIPYIYIYALYLLAEQGQSVSGKENYI